MREKEPQFTVTDRRKFTSEGELRDETATPVQPGSVQPSNVQPISEAAGGSVAKESKPPAGGPQIVNSQIVDSQIVDSPLDDPDLAEGEELIPEPTAAESAQQSREYQASSSRLDEMLQKANPGQAAPPPMNFERLLQSLYMTAAVQMGAGTPPNEQPRIDILGARQSIDMLMVLSEKTKGNLNDQETRMLQNALFDLRMSFLEITNAIAQSAQRPQKPGKLH
jgi:hypothetical protein